MDLQQEVITYINQYEVLTNWIWRAVVAGQTYWDYKSAIYKILADIEAKFKLFILEYYIQEGAEQATLITNNLNRLISTTSVSNDCYTWANPTQHLHSIVPKLRNYITEIINLGNQEVQPITVIIKNSESQLKSKVVDYLNQYQEFVKWVQQTSGFGRPTDINQQALTGYFRNLERKVKLLIVEASIHENIEKAVLVKDRLIKIIAQLNINIYNSKELLDSLALLLQNYTDHLISKVSKTRLTSQNTYSQLCQAIKDGQTDRVTEILTNNFDWGSRFVVYSIKQQSESEKTSNYVYHQPRELDTELDGSPKTHRFVDYFLLLEKRQLNPITTAIRSEHSAARQILQQLLASMRSVWGESLVLTALQLAEKMVDAKYRLVDKYLHIASKRNITFDLNTIFNQYFAGELSRPIKDLFEDALLHKNELFIQWLLAAKFIPADDCQLNVQHLQLAMIYSSPELLEEILVKLVDADIDIEVALNARHYSKTYLTYLEYAKQYQPKSWDIIQKYLSNLSNLSNARIIQY